MKRYRRLIAALLCTALVFGIIPDRFSMEGKVLAAETGGTQEGIKDEKTVDSVVEITSSDFGDEPSQYTITQSGTYVINGTISGNYGLVIDAPDVILEVGKDGGLVHKEKDTSETGSTLLYPNITVNSGASLTLRGEGEIKSYADETENANVLNKGTLTIEGNISLYRSIKAMSKVSGPAIYNMGGTLQVDGGVIRAQYGNAVRNQDGGTATINNGLLTSSFTSAIQNATGSLTVNGGIIESRSPDTGNLPAIGCSKGPNTLTINGGELKAIGTPYGLIEDSSNAESTIRITDTDIVSTTAKAGLYIEDNTKLYISGTSKIGGRNAGIVNTGCNANAGSNPNAGSDADTG